MSKTPFYPDAEAFYAVMEDLFGRIMADPAMIRLLRDSRAVLCIVTTAPDAVLHLDARRVPPRFLAGSACARDSDLRLRLEADTLHDVWLSKIRMRDAFAAGQIHLESHPLRALALLMEFQDLFRYAEKMYPVVLQERGLPSS